MQFNLRTSVWSALPVALGLSAWSTAASATPGREFLAALTGSRLTPRYEPGGRQLVTTRVGSTEKARRLLGFEAGKDLDVGLVDLLRWWRSRAQLNEVRI